jgi:hypothetical protein
MPGGAGDYLFSRTVQSGYGTHTYCYSMGTGFFPGVKRQRHAVDSSPPSIAEVKNVFKYATLPHGLLWRAQEQLYLFHPLYPYSFKTVT